jgi:hypothetical protein
MSRRPTQAAVPLAAEAAEPPARSARLIGADSSAAGPAGARLALASVACTAPGTRGPTLPERPEDPDNANPTRQLGLQHVRSRNQKLSRPEAGPTSDPPAQIKE